MRGDRFENCEVGLCIGRSIVRPDHRDDADDGRADGERRRDGTAGPLAFHEVSQVGIDGREKCSLVDRRHDDRRSGLRDPSGDAFSHSLRPRRERPAHQFEAIGIRVVDSFAELEALTVGADGAQYAAATERFAEAPRDEAHERRAFLRCRRELA